MSDLIIKFIGSLIFIIFGFWSIKRSIKKIKKESGVDSISLSDLLHDFLFSGGIFFGGLIAFIGLLMLFYSFKSLANS